MARRYVPCIGAALLVAGLGFLTADTASAGWGLSIRSGNYGHPNYSTSAYPNRGYGYQNYGYQSNRSYRQSSYSNRGYRGGHTDYHDTTHRDYVPQTVTQHRGHLDYTPAHYDVHRSGHYDRH